MKGEQAFIKLPKLKKGLRSEKKKEYGGRKKMYSWGEKGLDGRDLLCSEEARS